MHAAKVKVALGRDVSDVGGNAAGLGEAPDGRRRHGVVDGREDHVDVVEVGGEEEAVVVRDLVEGDAVGDFGGKARRGADDGYESVGVEAREDAACRDLERYSSVL